MTLEKQPKHSNTHTAHSFSLSSHSLSVLLSSFFLFLLLSSISVTLFYMGEVGKYMSHFVRDVCCVVGLVFLPGEGGVGGVKVEVNGKDRRTEG